MFWREDNGIPESAEPRDSINRAGQAPYGYQKAQPGGQRQTDPPDPLTGLRAGSVTAWPPQWNPCG